MVRQDDNPVVAHPEKQYFKACHQMPRNKEHLHTRMAHLAGQPAAIKSVDRTSYGPVWSNQKRKR
jgi:hypothetical protein